jgi:hypothetical protein
VRALMGGRDYGETEYNRAIQNNRLPGSGFKPFLYYAAFEKAGLSPASVFVDRKVAIPIPGQPPWAPRNFSGEYEGPMILKRALSRSVNSIAAQLVERIRAQAVIDAARRCGIKSPLALVPSLALGTSGVSPLEMASAFATLATGGIQHDPFWIRRVEDSAGRILEERILSSRRTLDASVAFQIVDMMRAVLDEGTGNVIRQLGFHERVRLGRVRPGHEHARSPGPRHHRRPGGGPDLGGVHAQGHRGRAPAGVRGALGHPLRPGRADDGPAGAAVGPARSGCRAEIIADAVVGPLLGGARARPRRRRPVRR